MTPAGRDWFGQPPGLTILFLTEMWEKFSFVGMRTLLVYYMTKHLLIGQQDASLIYGTYTGFVYLTPLLGGVLADRWLGRHKAVILGSSIMALGHALMTFEVAFYPALVTIIVGNGLFLPCLPSQIPELYGKDDPRRGSAFNIYYVGINLGAFLAALGCGILGERYGWHWGFGAAGIGMVLGLAIYVGGRHHLPPDPVRGSAAAAKAVGARLQRHWLLAGIAGSVIVFRGAYEQVGNTIALWADKSVARTLGDGWTIPATWFQSLNPLLVFLLTPLLVALWTWAAKSGHEPAPTRKMATGAALVAAAYLLLVLGATLAEGPAHFLWLVAFFVMLTIGELHILPIGLSLFARMAPPGMAATMVAFWLLASFSGNLFAGLLGTLWAGMVPAQYFLLMAAIAGTASLCLVLLPRRIEAGGGRAG